MKSWMSSIVVAVVVLGLGASANAQCQGKAEGAAAKATCDKTAKASCDKAGKEHCSGATAGLPKIICHVGEKTVNCPLEAEKLAKADPDAKVSYTVAGEDYADRGAALQAYANELNSHLEKMTSVQYNVGDKTVGCPTAAAALAKENGGKVKFRVAAYTFADKEAAEKAATAAKDAADKVVMKKVVDGKEVACASSKDEAHAGCGGAAGKSCSGDKAACHKDGEATAKAVKNDEAAGEKKSCTKDAAHAGRCCKSDESKTAEAKTEYVVGEMKTNCGQMAKVQLAMARIQAASKAVAEIAAKDGAGTEVARAD